MPPALVVFYKSHAFPGRCSVDHDQLNVSRSGNIWSKCFGIHYLSDKLVRSKLRTVTQTNASKGSFRCGNDCITCHYITDGRTNYTFSATGETRPIPDHIDCNSTNLIYMVHCRRCDKQYIGETKRRLKDRFNEHGRRPVDRPTPSSRPTAVSEHFNADDHLPNDMEHIPLELIHSSRDAIRKAREAYLIERGQTLEPKGINKREEV